MTNRFAFGDFAKTVKAIPNVRRGSEVQITGIGVTGGRLQCTAVLFNSHGEFQDFIGPFPESAFEFRRSPDPAEVEELLQLVVNNGPKTKSGRPAKHATL